MESHSVYTLKKELLLAVESKDEELCIDVLKQLNKVARDYT
jgi:hypothetical protein